jgi:hypothetical protein
MACLPKFYTDFAQPLTHIDVVLSQINIVFVIKRGSKQIRHKHDKRNLAFVIRKVLSARNSYSLQKR